MDFKISSTYTPMGDQPKAIEQLVQGVEQGEAHQTLLGVTGSGKTLVFAAGLIKNVEKGKGIQGLVLTPTRELAEQVAKELDNL